MGHARLLLKIHLTDSCPANALRVLAWLQELNLIPVASQGTTVISVIVNDRDSKRVNSTILGRDEFEAELLGRKPFVERIECLLPAYLALPGSGLSQLDPTQIEVHKYPKQIPRNSCASKLAMSIAVEDTVEDYL